MKIEGLYIQDIEKNISGLIEAVLKVEGDKQLSIHVYMADILIFLELGCSIIFHDKVDLDFFENNFPGSPQEKKQFEINRNRGRVLTEKR